MPFYSDIMFYAPVLQIREQILLLELTRAFLLVDKFDIQEICDLISKLREGRLKDKSIQRRSAKEISKQIFSAVATDGAFQKLLKEQLRMNCT